MSLVFQLNAGILLAAPSAPSAPSSPSSPTAPSSPDSPDSPDSPQSPSAPESPESPESPTAPTAPPAPTKIPAPTAAPTAAPIQTAAPGNLASLTPEPISSSQPEQVIGTGGQSDNGQVGDASIETGDATSSGFVSNDANTNLGLASDSDSDTGIKISDNSVGSDNEVSANLDSNTDVSQENSAKVVNSLNQDSTTGKNSTSRNTGGNSEITTGNANTSGTIINSVNTNIAGTSAHEFNISDNHTGDLILDFSGNGAESQNTANVNKATDINTFQNNDAEVENNLVLNADSGNNNANYNTGGDSTIQTGNANVSASVLNFVNNNLSGKLAYAAINIFGDLTGDIILTQEQLDTLLASIEGNGTESESEVNTNLASSNTTNQFNSADIDNNIVLNAETGDNETNYNTNGQNSILTGDSNAEVQVVNVANMNILTDKLWLVIVNDNGNWTGQVLGTDLSYIYNSDGSISVKGNGAESQNMANLNSTTSSTTTQNNSANIQNNISLSANTGGNSASRNTGGNNSIMTGDANIIANIVNFANNNIASDAGLFLSVINIFGSWNGDFVGPGYQDKDQKSENSDQEKIPESDNNSGTGGIADSNIVNTDNHVDEDYSSSSPVAISRPVGQITPTAASTYNTSANQFVPEVKAAKTDNTNPIADTQSNNNVNINLAWSIPFAGLLLSVEFLRRRFLG